MNGIMNKRDPIISLPPPKMKMVQNFYVRDDISRMLTGKKELMGKRETGQKRVLLLKIG